MSIWVMFDTVAFAFNCPLLVSETNDATMFLVAWI